MDEVSTGAVESPLVQPSTDAGVVSKEQVTEIVRREKEAAYRKAQREFQAQLDAQKTGQAQGMGGMQQPFNSDDIENRIVERLQTQIQQAQEESRKAEYSNFVQDQVKSYLGKMEKGTGIADDFQEFTAKFKPDKFKEVFYLVNSFENTPHLVYELMKNPYKLANIDYLAKTDPDLAREQLQSIAKSIDQNEHAKQNTQSAEAPLARPKPSLGTGVSDGTMTLADLKKASWLRG